MLKINPKFRDLIPPLGVEEYEKLRESIKADGCRDVIIVWNNVIIDGHNRYEICNELNIPYKTSEMEFENEEAVVEWIMFNQLARRNLSDVERIRLALQLKDKISAKAKEKQLSTLKQHIVKDEPSTTVAFNTLNEIGKIVGVSGKTVARVEKVDREAPEPIREAMGNVISIDRAAQLTKTLQSVPAVDRHTEAHRLLQIEAEEKCKEIAREGRIVRKLYDIISMATMNHDYIKDEYVELFIRDSDKSIFEIMQDIDYEIALLIRLRKIFESKNKLRMVE